MAGPNTPYFYRSGGGAGASGAIAFAYTAQTTTYAATINDFVTCSGASFTVTLPSAVGSTGKLVGIRHKGTSFTQVYTVASTSAQTINGLAASTYNLFSNGDSIYVISDGANWQIFDWNISVNARYYGATATVTSTPSAVSFATKDYDSHSAYSGSTLTIPIAGKYDFLGSLLVNSASIAAGQIWQVGLYKNTSNTNLPIHQYVSEGTNVSNAISLPLAFAGISCAASDAIVIQISSTATTPAITASTSSNFLSVKRVGN